MAFESFRNQGERRWRRQRQISFLLTIILHGALITGGVVYSYWHVEEVTTPRVRVTFMSIAPPPPPPPTLQLAAGREDAKRLASPPPPPAGAHARAKKVAIETKGDEPVPPVAEIVQPLEKAIPARNEFRKHDDEYDEDEIASPRATVYKDSIGDADSGEDHGVKGGANGGTLGGTPGGTLGGVSAAPGPQSVSPRVGTLQKESGNMPPFPSSLMHDKLVYIVDTKICVSTTGAVYRLTIRKRSGTVLDANVVDTVKTWRYRPLTVNDTPVPFCYPVRFVFRSES